MDRPAWSATLPPRRPPLSPSSAAPRRHGRQSRLGRAGAVSPRAHRPRRDPPPTHRTGQTPADAELIVTDGGRAFRVSVTAEVDGRPLAAVADDAFDRLFAALDRDRDLVLSEAEAAVAPAASALRSAANGPAARAVFAELDR